MCGITGTVSWNGLPESSIVDEMMLVLNHRGPDDSGVYRDSNAVLGHKRLSIIDLSPAGRQPMSNEDETLWSVFNGEIYNFMEIRNNLEGRGHKFKSKTDSEVLVHLYEEYKEKMVEHLSGMFAFAIWDKVNQKLFFARDRMGKKPFYYFTTNDGIVFASELKALLRHPWIHAQINPSALRSFLILGYIPGELSIISGIKKLPSGCAATFQRSGLKLNSYYRVEDEHEDGSCRDAKELENILAQAVKRRLVADVEVGVFLSGGIDSSLIAWLASRQSPIRAFSIGFSEKEFDESSYARTVAKKLGLTIIHRTLQPADMLNAIPNVFQVFDEPFADASAIPTYILCKLTSEHVKVALCGDGGDELFGGYPTLKAQFWAEKLQTVPCAFQTLKMLSMFLPESEKYYPAGYILKRFLTGVKFPSHLRQQLWTAYIQPEELSDLGISTEWPNELLNILESCKSEHFQRTSHLLDQKLYLPDDILVKSDRASMGNSMEVRAPFLDKDVVTFSAGLKYSQRSNKRILRDILSHSPIAEIGRRKKRGFAVPMARWLRGELKDWALEHLESVIDYGIERKGVNKFWEEHQSRRRDRWRELYALIAFSLWQKSIH